MKKQAKYTKSGRETKILTGRLRPRLVTSSMSGFQRRTSAGWGRRSACDATCKSCSDKRFDYLL